MGADSVHSNAKESLESRMKRISRNGKGKRGGSAEFRKAMYGLTQEELNKRFTQ